MKCRHCKNNLTHTFVDLGFAPPSNAYLDFKDLNLPEKYYPLRVKVCDNCWLVQTEDYANADDLFSHDYAYYSSTSSSWLKHAKDYSEHIIDTLGLDNKSIVVEVASNDGYLLRNFLNEGIPCIGIEPTAGTAAVAEKYGIPVVKEFFGEELAKRLVKEGKKADLIAGNNVYAHVPDINDFTKGLKELLKDDGTITLEFPHLLRLIESTQFDTIYHEHFSYLSLYTVMRIFQSVGLRVWDVKELSTHGGSIRVYGCHEKDSRKVKPSVEQILTKEQVMGLQKVSTFDGFQDKTDKIKNDLLSFLIEQKNLGKKVAAYGAAAKGNTLLNYAGVKSDLLPFVCDMAASKQGKLLPGSHIPILDPSKLLNEEIDYLLVLPWNIVNEIKDQNVELQSKGVRFVTAVPEMSF